MATKAFKATNPGDAFARCLEKFPEAKLIESWREGGYLDGWGITTYEPPPSTTAIPNAETLQPAEQLLFPFET